MCMNFSRPSAKDTCLSRDLVERAVEIGLGGCTVSRTVAVDDGYGGWVGYGDLIGGDAYEGSCSWIVW